MAARRYSLSHLHGLIPIYKPSGVVSKDISRWFDKRFGRLKMGHVGTLDPLADGVLPLVIGNATRLQDYLLEQEKTYVFEVEFGRSTTTMDSDGEWVASASFEHIKRHDIEIICENLKGEFFQVPPIYSAIKYQGKPLYEYARSGRANEVPIATLGKHVKIHELQLLDLGLPRAKFEMTCSKGTYVRVVATKIAELLASCATVVGLHRSQAAGVAVIDCWTLEQVEALGESWEKIVIPQGRINFGLPKCRLVDNELVRRLFHGQKLVVDLHLLEEGFQASNCSDVDLNLTDTIVLVDDRFHSLAIANVELQSAGLVRVSMKRGLV